MHSGKRNKSQRDEAQDGDGDAHALYDCHLALDELLEEMGASPSVDTAVSLPSEDVHATAGCVVLAAGVRDAENRFAVLGRLPVQVAVDSAALEVTLNVESCMASRFNCC